MNRDRLRGRAEHGEPVAEIGAETKKRERHLSLTILRWSHLRRAYIRDIAACCAPPSGRSRRKSENLGGRAWIKAAPRRIIRRPGKRVPAFVERHAQ